MANVQTRSSTTGGTPATVTVNVTGAQATKNLNIVALASSLTTTAFANPTDTSGNVYHPIGTVNDGISTTIGLFYAYNIAAALAGANTISVGLTNPGFWVDLIMMEESNILSTSDPLRYGDKAINVSSPTIALIPEVNLFGALATDTVVGIGSITSITAGSPLVARFTDTGGTTGLHVLVQDGNPGNAIATWGPSGTIWAAIAAAFKSSLPPTGSSTMFNAD